MGRFSISRRLSAALLWAIAAVVLISISMAPYSSAEEEAEFAAEDSEEVADIWQPFESEEGKFEVLFPGEPELKESVRDTVFGEIKERHYEISSEEGEFSAEYNDLPMLISLLATDRMIYRRAKDALLKELKADEVYFVKVDGDGLPGMEIGFETKRDIGIARLYMKKKRLYVLVATVPKRRGEAMNISKFIDSFEHAGKRGRKPHKYIDMRQAEQE